MLYKTLTNCASIDGIASLRTNSLMSSFPRSFCLRTIFLLLIVRAPQNKLRFHKFRSIVYSHNKAGVNRFLIGNDTF